jgi:hypothetical protein
MQTSSYPLNGIERFMLQHESEAINYSSHLVFEFNGRADRHKLLRTTQAWIECIPHVRSRIHVGLWRSQRYVHADPWFSASDIFEFGDRICGDKIDRFCQRGFDLLRQPAVRFLHLGHGDRSVLVFSCHHSLFDGWGQAYAFEEWSRIYNGDSGDNGHNRSPHTPRYSSAEGFRFREIIGRLGVITSISLLLQNLSLRPPRASVQIASLGDSSSLHRARHVKAVSFRVPPDSELRQRFYERSLSVLDRALTTLGDPDRPVVAYCPVGLRVPLRIRRTLQNAVVSHVLFVKRASFRDGSLARRITDRLRADPVIANKKFLFGTLPLCAFGVERVLRRQFARMDENSRPATSTALLVHAPIPKRMVTPQGWEDLYISGRGALLRSPAVGLVFSGKAGRETMTLEYVEGLVNPGTVAVLLDELQACLQS